MANHNSFIDNVSKRQRTEKLRKSFINSIILILSLHLSLKAINMVYLLSLMISTSHMQKINIRTLPSNQSQYTLHRKRPSINKVPIEQIFIAYRRILVQSENIHQVVVLTVNVPTNRNLLLITNPILHQRFIV